MQENFSTTRKGYDKAEVNAAFDELHGLLRALQNETADLKSQNEALQAEVAAYKAKEAAVSAALIQAGELRENIIMQANRQLANAQTCLHQSEETAQAIREEANRTLDRVEYILKRQMDELTRLRNA